MTQPEPEPSTSKLPEHDSVSPSPASADSQRLADESEGKEPAEPKRVLEKWETDTKWIVDLDQPSAAQLAAYGIKARDHAIEKTLPVIRNVVFSKPVVLQVQQVQPGHADRPPPRPLKRTRRDGTEVEDFGYGFVMGVARTAPPPDSPPRRVQRMGTGRALRREGGLLSLKDEAELRAATYDVFGATSQSQDESQSQSQEYLSLTEYEYYCVSQGTSQDADGNIPTPMVTPNGSLRWIPPRSPPLPPTEPVSLQNSPDRAPTPPPPPAAPVSPSPAPRRSTSPALLRTTSALSALSSPLTSAPPSAQGSMALILPAAPPTPTPPPPPRYELRKRAAPTSPSSLRVAPPKRARRGAPLRREDSFSVVISS